MLAPRTPANHPLTNSRIASKFRCKRNRVSISVVKALQQRDNPDGGDVRATARWDESWRR